MKLFSYKKKDINSLEILHSESHSKKNCDYRTVIIYYIFINDYNYFILFYHYFIQKFWNKRINSLVTTIVCIWDNIH